MGKKWLYVWIAAALLLALAYPSPAQAVGGPNNWQMVSDGQEVEAIFTEDDGSCIRTWVRVFAFEQFYEQSWEPGVMHYKFASVQVEQFDYCQGIQLVQVSTSLGGPDLALTFHPSMKSASLALDFTAPNFVQPGSEVHVALDLEWESYGKLQTHISNERSGTGSDCNFLLHVHGKTRSAYASGWIALDGHTTSLGPVADASISEDHLTYTWLSCHP